MPHDTPRCDYLRTCGACGEQFKAHGSRAKWCSLQCRNWNARNPGVPIPRKVCETCGDAVLHLARRWCSPECTPTRRSGRADTPARRVRERTVGCAHCGQVFTTARTTSRFCSAWCGDHYLQAARYAERLGRTCEWCREPLPVAARLGRRFCSTTHQVMHNQHIRRAREASLPAEDVSLGEVLQRDGWECHLCGNICDEDTVSLDHLIPIAHPDSPGHVAANLGVAHRSCNSGKRDRVSERDWERYHANTRRCEGHG